jgi:hypothetical protein
MLFRERVTVYCDSQTKKADDLWAKRAVFYYVKTGGILTTNP